MILNYTKKELNEKINFDFIYNTLKKYNNQFILLGNNSKIDSDESAYYSGTIIKNKKYFNWRYYGSSAVDANKKYFKWLFEKIFNDCNYFQLMDSKTYYEKCENYFNKEFEKRQKELENLEG